MLQNLLRAIPAIASFSLLYVFLVGTHPITAGQSAGSYRLETMWEFVLHGDPMSFSSAVCPDGTVFAMHDRELQIIGPDGHLIGSDPSTPVSIHRTPIACNGEKRLFVAGEALSIFELDQQGRMNKISSVTLRAVVDRILVLPDGSIYGLIGYGVILISASGEEIFLKRNQHPGVYSWPPEDPECAMTWDKSRARLAYMFPGWAGIGFVEPSGKHAGRDLVPPSTRSVSAYACALPAPANLASLPNGQLARTQTYRSEIADVFNKTYLEILDGSSGIVAQSLPVNGLLLGSSDDGALYFVEFRESHDNELNLTKRLLVQESSGQEN